MAPAELAGNSRIEKKMKNLLIIIALVSSIAACDKLSPKKAIEPAPILEKEEKVIQNFDVDIERTEALKKSLLDKYPPTLETEAIEGFLKTEEYECRIDPTNKEERACDKVEDSAGCILMTVVKTKPYTPEKAQVIKVCGVGVK